jgi:uncharacterized OsmC-like protein
VRARAFGLFCPPVSFLIAESFLKVQFYDRAQKVRMLNRAFSRCFAGCAPAKATIRHIADGHWFCLNSKGKGALLSTVVDGGLHPVDSVLMAYGACAASDFRFLLEERGKQVHSLVTEVEGVFDKQGTRITDIVVDFKIDVDGVTPEELNTMVAEVQEKMSPIHQTLGGGTKLKVVY